MLIILLLTVATLLKLIFDTYRYAIGPTPSNRQVQQVVFDDCDQRKPLSICDLGCGFGFFSFKLARRYPNTVIYSIEAALIPYLVAQTICQLSRQKNWKVVRRNFFEMEKIPGELVYCFLYCDKMNQIARHLTKALKPKTVVIASTFWLCLKEKKKIKAQDVYHTPIYFFEV